MREDRMTHELIGELYRRYMRGDLSLADAADQIHALMRDGVTGFSVATGGMSAADQDRTHALFGQLQWHAMREAMPGVDIPPITGPDFSKHLDQLDAGDETE
jgi:hypothetical protein